MQPSPRVQDRLKAIDERVARLRAQRERLAARASRAERRRETRRKIVLGGTVLAALDREGVPALKSLPELVAWLDRQLNRPQDRAVFELVARQSGRG